MSAPCPLHGVDDHIRGDNFVRPFLVAIDQRADGLFDLSLDQTAHFRDHAEEDCKSESKAVAVCPGLSNCMSVHSFGERMHGRNNR